MRIGFDRETYFVDESNELVTLVITLISGELSEDVVVQLDTRDNTALGIHASSYTVFFC